MLSHISHVLLYVIPWTVAHQVTLSMGFSGQEYSSGSSCPPLGYFPHPSIKPMPPAFPAMQTDYLPTEPPGKPLSSNCCCCSVIKFVQLFAIPCIAACQVYLCFTNSWSLLKLMSIESVMLSNHLIFCHLHLLLPSIFPSIRLFSNELVLCSYNPLIFLYYLHIKLLSAFMLH